MAKKSSPRAAPSYDVCLSFAGEDRAYVEALARVLREAGVRTFYDEFEKAHLWGKDLYAHLYDIYQNQAKYCVVFISEHYAKKAWTIHERRSAQARALISNVEYILPVRFDDTEIPGIANTIGFIDIRITSPDELCSIIIQKVGPRPRENYFPPNPDRLFKRFRARSKKDQVFIQSSAYRFFQALTRMNKEERGFVYDIFSHCCPAELPENVHISLDLLRRITRMQPAKIKRVGHGIQSLGFYCSIRDKHDMESEDDDPIFVMEWQNMSLPDGGNDTLVANETIYCATDLYCDEHARMMFERLDFGQLGTSTTTRDEH